MTGPTRPRRSRGPTRPRSTSPLSPPLPTFPTPLLSTAAALDVLRAALPPGPGVVALPLDDAHWGRTVVSVDRTPHDDSVLEVVQLLLTASGFSHLVVASHRPFELAMPQGDDWCRWCDLLAMCDEAGVELLDWFLLGADDDVVSMAELDELPESRWVPG